MEVWGVHRFPPISPGEIGQKGEEVVAQFLKERGWQIVARRWRWRGGEIDLITYKPPLLYFWEVKSSWNCPYNPLERISPSKLDRLRKGALLFLTTPLANPPLPVEGVVLGGAGVCFSTGHLYLVPL